MKTCKDKRKFRNADLEQQKYNENWIQETIDELHEYQRMFIDFADSESYKIYNICIEDYEELKPYMHMGYKTPNSDFFDAAVGVGIPKKTINTVVYAFGVHKTNVLLPLWYDRIYGCMCEPDQNFKFGIDWKIYKCNKIYAVSDLYFCDENGNMCNKEILIPSNIMKYGVHLSDNSKDIINTSYTH